jgi:hypothetical protein
MTRQAASCYPLHCCTLYRRTEQRLLRISVRFKHFRSSATSIPDTIPDTMPSARDPESHLIPSFMDGGGVGAEKEERKLPAKQTPCVYTSPIRHAEYGRASGSDQKAMVRLPNGIWGTGFLTRGRREKSHSARHSHHFACPLRIVNAPVAATSQSFPSLPSFTGGTRFP